MKKTNRYVRLTSKTFEDMKLYGKENYCNQGEELDITNTALIQKILYDAFLHCLNYKKANRNTSVEAVIKAEQNDHDKMDIRISFRMSDEMCIAFEDYYGKTDNLSFALRCAIRDLLSNNRRPSQLAPTEKVRCMIGQKNDEMTELLKEIFNDIATRRTINGYHEPFAGTANVYLHTNITCHTILNDNSELGCNLTSVIKNYPTELKEEILSLTLSEVGFNNGTVELKTIKLTNKRNRIRAAALHFLLCNCSYYGKGENFYNRKRFLEMLDVISVAHERLQNADIRKGDALYYLHKLTNVTNQLIYLDPPYIGTEAYYKEQNLQNKEFKLHQQLRNKVVNLSKNNICIVSYRITASRTMALKNIPSTKGLSIEEKELLILEEKRSLEHSMKCKLDDLYLNRGFYIAFKKLKRTQEQIEIIISSEPFSGSTPYTTSLTEMEVA